MPTIAHDPTVPSQPWLVLIPAPGRSYEIATRCASELAANTLARECRPGRVIQ